MPSSNKQQNTDGYGSNPYEEFMKKHLSHYGYYTGRNKAFRSGNLLFNDLNRTHGYQLSSDSSSSSDEDSPSEGAAHEQLKTNQLVLSVESGKLVPKLKEPRQLFPINNVALGPQQKARWPAEIEVAVERVKHIANVPQHPEPFYTMSGNELTPMIVGEEGGGRVVFQLQSRTAPFFLHSRVGGTRGDAVEAAVELEGPEDTTLIFESRFESGNLAKAIQVGLYDYELWLRNDLYTNKHTQWYYFKIQNTRKNIKYRFTICNLMKSDSLYNNGMKPCYYSEKDAEQKQLGWRRMGSDIKYYKSNNTYVFKKSEKNYYALTFTMQFSHDNDTVYFSHCYPYTYADLQDYLQNIIDDPVKSKICRMRVLARSLAGNLIYLMSITSPSEDSLLIKNKKAVVISARVHPGETNGSWMMKGFLDYLLSEAADAKLLRDTFIFKIVPMLNPDGVIVGNYRCSLAGRDLNRNYKSQLKDSYPTIMAMKEMIKKLTTEREVVMYCDLHGHSRKQNVFIYGCENRRNPKERLHERVFPAMLGKNCPDKFVFHECNFKVQKNKEGTGRVVMWNMGIMNSFTMEATFCGSVTGENKSCHFNASDFESMGYHFCDTLLDYCDPDKTKFYNVLNELEESLKCEILNQLARLGKKAVTVNGRQVDLANTNGLSLDDIYAAGLDVSADDGGSDSSVSDGLPVNIEYMEQLNNPQKRKKMSKKERDMKKKKAEQEPSSSIIGGNKIGNSVIENGLASGRLQPSISRHDKCHNGATSRPIRKCFSAKRSKSNDPDKVEAKVRRDDVEGHDLCITGAKYDVSDEEPGKCKDINHKNSYLEAITKEFLTNGDIPSSGSTLSPARKGHFRYSTSSSNKPLAMSLDGLSDYTEGSFSAQFLLDKVQDAENGPTEASVIKPKAATGARMRKAYTNMAKGDAPPPTNILHDEVVEQCCVHMDMDWQLLVQRLKEMRSDGKSTMKESPVIPESYRKEGSVMWSYQQTQPRLKSSRSDNRRISESTNESEHCLTSGKMLKQHSMPFDRHAGNGAVEGGHYSVPYVTRTLTRPSTRQSQSRNKISSSGNMNKKLVQELQDIKKARETLAKELSHTDVNPATGRYIEKMVSETDKDIEFLRAEIEGMQTREPTVLELAARQRRLNPVRNSQFSNILQPVGDRDVVANEFIDYSTRILANGFLSNHDGAEPKMFQFKESSNSSKQQVSRVSLHMHRHELAPSAPKASRRVQIKMVPQSRESRRLF